MLINIFFIFYFQVIIKKSRSGAVFTETATAIKSASFGAKTAAVSRNISVKEFIKKVHMFFICCSRWTYFYTKDKWG